MALRAGLIGFGMMGRNHARVLSSMEGVRLVGIADPAEPKHDLFGDVPMVDGVQALLELGIDLAVVATPTEDHLVTGELLAEAGVHTLIEKPLAETTEAAQRLAERFDRAGLVGAVGHIERYNPALRELRRRLQNGDLGDIFQVFTRRIGPFPRRVRDVGVVMDLATHDFDLTTWVAERDYKTVFACTAHKTGRAHEDLLAITGTLADGLIVNHLVNWLSPMKERLIIVTGERGCYVADTLLADLTFYEAGHAVSQWDEIYQFRGESEGDVIRYGLPKPEPLRVELEAFRDAVLGNGDGIVSMHDGLAAVSVAEAVLESATSGATVAVGCP